jgi:hypothetical protein
VNQHLRFIEPFRGHVLKYDGIARSYLDRSYKNRNVYRCVFPSWDNTARTHLRALIVLNGSPPNYEYWLAESIKRTLADFPGEQRLVFINAWNEWAEGCHLEPDRRYQRGFLEATQRAKGGRTPYRKFHDTDLPGIGHGHARTFFGDIRFVCRYHFALLLSRLATWLKRHPHLRTVIRGVIGKSGRLIKSKPR